MAAYNHFRPKTDWISKTVFAPGDKFGVMMSLFESSCRRERIWPLFEGIVPPPVVVHANGRNQEAVDTYNEKLEQHEVLRDAALSAFISSCMDNFPGIISDIALLPINERPSRGMALLLEKNRLTHNMASKNKLETDFYTQKMKSETVEELHRVSSKLTETFNSWQRLHLAHPNIYVNNDVMGHGITNQTIAYSRCWTTAH